MKKNFKATIITPFHNTDIDLFVKTMESVKGQTIGFQNIEWIIVLHNCGQEYLDAVHSLLDSYDNVLLKELRNDAKSASSPRNYALQFITSPYVEFLDSDDTISPNTIETCLSTMEKHHPDIVIFRMAYEKENDSVTTFLTDRTLWNMMEDEIILEGENLKRMELYFGDNFITHNKFFGSDFIRNNRLTFDESITMAEDAYFTIQCYLSAVKIVVLPHFIGHCYFINGNSAMQSANKTPAQVLGFIDGFKKIFDALLENDVYFDHICLGLLATEIEYALRTPGFSLKDWQILQAELASYAKKIEIPPVNKFFSKEQGLGVYRFITQNILVPKTDPEKDAKAFRNGERLLLSALNKNESTDFGKFYHYNEISSIEDYQAKVPLQTNEDYMNLVDMQTNVGETQVITVEPIKNYAVYYSVEDRLILIPLADSLCRNLGRNFVSQNKGQTTFLMMESIPRGMAKNDGAYLDSVSGILLNSSFSTLSATEYEQTQVFTSPVELIFPRKSLDHWYLNLLIALKNPEVTQIYSSSTRIVAGYLDVLVQYADDLCFDIACGTISHGDKECRKMAGRIAAAIIPDRERALAVREALRRPREEILHAIWPDLEKIIAESAGIYSLYTRRVESWCSGIHLEYGDLVTPYGIIGFGTLKPDVYELNPENAFYEFLPADEYSVDGISIVLMTELKTGHTYEIILTNAYGIYRMHTGIFITPLQLSEESLWYRVVQEPICLPDGSFINSERVEQILWEESQGKLRDYFYHVDESTGQLIFLLNMGTEKADQKLVSDFTQKLQNGLFSENKKSKRVSVQLLSNAACIEYRMRIQKKYQIPEDSYLPVKKLSAEAFMRIQGAILS